MPPHPSCEAGAPGVCNTARRRRPRRGLLAIFEKSALNTPFRGITVIAEPGHVLLTLTHHFVV